MAIGTVKWYDEDLDFGFIEADSGDDIVVEGTYAQLMKGQRVEFDLIQRGRHPAAVHVVALQAVE